MKSILKITSFILVFTLASSLYAQDKSKRDLDNYRQPDKRGINVFEAPKDTVSTFENINKLTTMMECYTRSIDVSTNK